MTGRESDGRPENVDGRPEAGSRPIADGSGRQNGSEQVADGSGRPTDGSGSEGGAAALDGKRRTVLGWATAVVAGARDSVPGLQGLVEEIVADRDLPELLVDPDVSMDSVVQRYPELESEFDDLAVDLEAGPGGDPGDPEDAGGGSDGAARDRSGDERRLDRAILYAKLLVTVFGSDVSRGSVSAADYSRWCDDVAYLERAYGYAPGELLGASEGPAALADRDGPPSPATNDGRDGEGPGAGLGAGAGTGTGSGPMLSEREIRRRLERTEADIVERMELPELLQDRELAEEITPSMPVVEQLLRDKEGLSEEALANAKRIIRSYVDDLADELELVVDETTAAEYDPDQPPRRTYRTLDLRRTVWTNLPNWDPDEEKLYVDELHFERETDRQLPSTLIVVVDQSGSMVDAMVNCAVLASIFASLPHVEAHLVAYDTRVVDLSEHVETPFEVLMRTELGGGTEGMVAMPVVERKVRTPERTAVVWISDFFDFDKQQLYDRFRELDADGVHLIPVGSVDSSGYQRVDSWMKRQFEELGTPLISGSVETLVEEIEAVVG